MSAVDGGETERGLVEIELRYAGTVAEIDAVKPL